MALKFAQCMRSHGVTNFPDPTVSSNGSYGGSVKAGSGGVDPNSPTFQAAMQDCAKYGPGGNLSPAQKAQQQAQQLKYAQCMRSHGVTNFPNPSADGSIIIGPNSGLDQNSPTFKAAQKACQSIAVHPNGS